jgi:hypothetical protein
MIGYTTARRRLPAGFSIGTSKILPLIPGHT